MKKEKRVTIYMLYCSLGQLLESDLFLINELSCVSSNLIVVINGDLNNSELLHKYTRNIIFRKNTGYDAAAYKEVLKEKKFYDLVTSCEELVLCNNSFFGPFESFSFIFEKMKNSECDFWGITSVKHDIVEHIQSYFIVFRKKILDEGVLFVFFDKYISFDMSYDGVCREFEIGLYNWLLKMGYKPSAYVQNITCDNYKNYYGSLKLDGVPVIKRKAFSNRFFDEICVNEALQYICTNYLFDINIIIKDVAKLYGHIIQADAVNQMTLFDVEPDIFELPMSVDKAFIDQFINNHNNVYIYGTGDLGKHLYNCFFYASNQEKLLGFIESDDVENHKSCFMNKPVYGYSSIKDKKIPIILAMSEKNSREVKMVIDEGTELLQLWGM